MRNGATIILSRRLIAFLVLALASCALAQGDGSAVTYTVDTSLLKNHKLVVKATFPPSAFPTQTRELALPVWTPGSYKVRDYSRFLSEVKALDPGVEVVKSTKNRWLVTGLAADQPLRVSYTVYGHELTVRTNYFTPELALIIGAATFMAPAPLESSQMVTLPYRVEFTDRSQPIASGMVSPTPGVFVAGDYDSLVDSPILLGDIESHDFTVGGALHELVQAGDRRYWDLKKSLKDAAALVKTHQQFWGVIPYRRYLFMNLITDTRGGLEHQNSTVVMTSRFATEDREKYLGWLSLMSHEFFHTWNVKRLRPSSLGPFDYEDEIYTRSLWVAEGITSYYDDLLVRRAGLSTRKEYLKALSSQLNRLLETPGRREITLGDASFDAWIRLYQPSDDLHNSNISYYNKGAVVAWLLDTEIRKRTGDKKSLDDVMRVAYKQFQVDGFEESEFRETASQVAGADLSRFFGRTLDSTQELPLQPALEYWNLTWEPKSEEAEPYLGVEASGGSRVVVEKVYAGSPAARAGIAPGDELLAIDGVRLESGTDLLEYLKAGDVTYPVLISRLGRVSTVEVQLGAPPHRESSLALGKESKTAKRRWQSWLGPESETGP